MSRSKAAAQGIPPAPRETKSTFRTPNGELRTGWLLAISLAAYVLLALATRYELVRAFAALFRAWGVNASTAQRAPAWARLLYVWHGSIATLAFAGLSLVLTAWLRRLWRLRDPAPFSAGTALRVCLAGFGGAILVAALCLLPDSVRTEWPLAAPRLTWPLPVLCGVSLIGALGEETFCKRMLYDGVKGRWGRLWATVVACAVFFFTNGGYGAGPVGALNVLLLGWLGCLLYDRYGLWSVVGFRWSWSVVNVFLLGFGGGDAAVYRLYGVSEDLLTGGDGGPVYGLWTTLLMAGLIARLWLTGRGQEIVYKTRKQTD